MITSPTKYKGATRAQLVEKIEELKCEVVMLKELCSTRFSRIYDMQDYLRKIVQDHKRALIKPGEEP